MTTSVKNLPQVSPESSKKIRIAKPGKFVTKQPSAVAAELLKAIEDGNEILAIDVLKKLPELVNHQDGFAKLSIVQKSIYKSCDKILEHLLKQPNLKLDLDTLLHAICVGNEEYVEKLLDVMDKRKLDSKKADPNSWCFEPYMTPLMLACLLDDFQIVKLLRAKGHTLDTPHRANCSCAVCGKERKGGEDLISSEKRFAVLRSLASQAYLLQDDYEDPIMDAIMLSRELEKCQALEHAMAAKYECLRESLCKIPLAIIAECSTDNQVRTLLKNPIGSSMECATSLPRLRVALDMHNKEFLAERRCQKIVYNEWMREWADWRLVAPRIQSFRVLIHTLFFPIVSLMFVFSLGKFPSSCRIPFARFLSFGTAHFVYLCCLLMNMQYKENRDEIGPPHSVIKKVLFGYIWLYVAGDLSILLTDVWRLGFRRFFDVWWRWYLIIVAFLYLVNFHAFCIAWAHAREENYPKLHRTHWDPLESTLIFEVLFAALSILSTWRIFYFLQLNRIIGPTIISIGRCVKDVALYIVIMFSIMFSFAIGLNYLYEHYKYNVARRPDGSTIEQPHYLASITTAMRYLYWCFYGYLDPDRMAIVVGNSGPNHTETVHWLVGTAGELLCAFYYGVLIIILLQLMVSMMTNTAAKIMEKEDLEWKYHCTHLRAEFFEDNRLVAPPFCLLQLLINASICMIRKFTTGRGKILSMWDWQYKDPEYTQKDYMRYNDLMRILTEKMLAKQELAKRKAEPTSEGSSKGATWYATLIKR